MNTQKIVSAKLEDPKIWEDFKSICANKGVKMAFELERVLREYIDKNKKTE